MMVTFVSQCEKKALNRTRRVLDSFANRIGDNTWQTVITNEGLTAVKKLLRKTASKSTAVSCFWIRSRSRSELVWVVGNRAKFNSEGVVPVNSTKRDLINADYENDWKFLPLIKALTAISALLHDWGKATILFQEKLNPNSKNKYKYKGDPIRHEWISCLLLHALVQNSNSQSDEAWLDCLINVDWDEQSLKESVYKHEKKPLHQLPNTAKLVAWLIVSHHRLPVPNTDVGVLEKKWQGEASRDLDTVLKRIEQSWGYQNRKDEDDYRKRITDCFEFPNGLLSQSPRWIRELKKWAQRLRECEKDIVNVMSNGSYRLILHHARLCLMLGDHFYSSQNADLRWKGSTGLFANTDRIGELKQHLDEHLFGVAKSALHTAHHLPAFEREPPVANDIASLKKNSPPTFRWQDKAVEVIKNWKQNNTKKQHGFFVVNMASTGCGKTFANAKVMRALSDDGQSLRYILALGLRTLTLQTGDEYRQRIGLESDELAVLIGSKAVTALHNKSKEEQQSQSLNTGSESEQPLLDEYVYFEGNIPEEGLSTVLTCDKDRQFLYAPVLACTIDHMMAATETKRGGRYILPSLRLMSSDLVIDEIDDFTGSDLIAIGRLIHLAGMLGRKVMISSATIPPDLAEGYFHAYKMGWRVHNQCRDAANDIACVWIDEFRTDISNIHCAEIDTANNHYQQQHKNFIEKRVAKLSQQDARRKAEIIDCAKQMEDCGFDENETKQQQYFSIIQQAILNKHQQHHTIDEKTNIAVSFGVVRVANISPCVELTKYLLQNDCPDDFEIKTMAYHSKQVLLLRHEQEKHLDEVLKRNKDIVGEQPSVFNNEIIRHHLDRSEAKNILFVLVATPVEEVGRDHDFDWAVVEPSSYRSIIQLAGRVRRHRDGEVSEPNIALMQYNWRAFKKSDEAQKKYFNRPGYEEKITLESHDLKQLINEHDVVKRLDAIPRIQKSEPLNYQSSLADLEHYATHELLTNYQRMGPDSMQGYLQETWYLTALPQYMNPFRKSKMSTNLFLVYDEEKDACYFAEKNEQGYAVKWEGSHDTHHYELSEAEAANLWLKRDYQNLLIEYVNEVDLISKRRVSLRYGELNIALDDGVEYEYSDQFGLVVIK